MYLYQHVHAHADFDDLLHAYPDVLDAVVYDFINDSLFQRIVVTATPDLSCAVFYQTHHKRDVISFRQRHLHAKTVTLRKPTRSLLLDDATGGGECVLSR